jgi:SAM-dependent methyltransferase
LNYRLAYAIGFHPWEDAANDPVFVGKFHELIDREEKGRSRPFGPALDIGTGSGIWGIELAKRGWQVTGVDNIPKALDRARERVQVAGVNMQLVEGDVTAIRRTGLRAGFRLVLDTGTFHDFDPTHQQAMGQEIDAIATSDESILLLVWPRRVRPLIRGVSRAEIEAAFTNWKITHVEASYFQLPKFLQAILRPDEHWYRLTRKSA